MTKQIRIENADTSDHKMRVFVENRKPDGTWQRDAQPIALDYPTAMHSSYVHSGQRLVVEELSAD